MQRLNRLLYGDHPVHSERAAQRRQLVLGIIGAGLLVVMLVVSGILYVVPFGQKTYTAELSEAQAIKAGDEIRVAGIHVGSVKSLELGSDRVTMRFTVDSSVFMGDQTTLDIRMLTLVGGHYVAVFPAGTAPLGSKPIPADHVKLPYSLIQTLQDAAKPLAQVNGNTLRETFNALQGSLDKNPDGLRRIGDALESFVTVLDKQNVDVSKALSLADEYIGAVSVNRGIIGRFVTQVGLLEGKALAKKDEILTALDVTTQLLSRIAALEPAWRTELKPLADKFYESIPELERLGKRLDDSINTIHDMGDRLQHIASPDGIAVRLPCVPSPGRVC